MILALWIVCTLACTAITFACAIFGWLAGVRFGRWLSARRCRSCADRDSCEAVDTGVAYPCPHYRHAGRRSCSTCSNKDVCLAVYAGHLPVQVCAYWQAAEKPL